MKDRVSEGGSARTSRKKGQGRMLSTEYINWIPSTQQGGEEVGGERVREQLPHTASCLFGKIMLPWKACTMSSVSHNVPDPFRKTSSGSMGMIVHKAKMKGWTYFM